MPSNMTFKANERVRVNISTVVNAASIREEKRNGRDVIIASSATLPFGIVMNGIMYPEDEIRKSYSTLNRKPAPLGHPTINGEFVSASDPEGLNLGWIGAWNENARIEGNRVLLDKVIDVDIANSTEKGRSVLAALNEGKPIHTSNALLCNVEAYDKDGAEWKALNMEFDHDAILLNEEGAGTPEQGVGMLVNSGGNKEQIQVINSVMSQVEDDLDWAADMAARAVEKMERAPVLERIKSAIKEAIAGTSERETSANQQGDADMADEKQLGALSDQVSAINKTMEGIGDLIAKAVENSMAPVTEQLNKLQEAQKAAAEAERSTAVNALVKTGAWEEAELADMPIAAINKLLAKATPKKAAALNATFTGGTEEDEFKDFNLNASMDEKGK